MVRGFSVDFWEEGVEYNGSLAGLVDFARFLSVGNRVFARSVTNSTFLFSFDTDDVYYFNGKEVLAINDDSDEVSFIRHAIDNELKLIFIDSRNPFIRRKLIYLSPYRTRVPCNLNGNDHVKIIDCEEVFNPFAGITYYNFYAMFMDQNGNVMSNIFRVLKKDLDKFLDLFEKNNYFVSFSDLCGGSVNFLNGKFVSITVSDWPVLYSPTVDLCNVYKGADVVMVSDNGRSFFFPRRFVGSLKLMRSFSVDSYLRYALLNGGQSIRSFVESIFGNNLKFLSRCKFDKKVAEEYYNRVKEVI